MKQFSVGISVASPLVYSGLCVMIKSAAAGNVIIVDASGEDLHQLVMRRRVSALIVDALAVPAAEVAELKAESEGRLSTAVVYHSALPPSVAKAFDQTFSIYDDLPTFAAKFKKLTVDSRESIEHKELTARECEIVRCVVMGLSNKEIATQVNLSVNTVMTHRRNIAAKLQIHTAAGLTIYALASKLVKLEEVSGAMAGGDVTL